MRRTLSILPKPLTRHQFCYSCQASKAACLLHCTFIIFSFLRNPDILIHAAVNIWRCMIVSVSTLEKPTISTKQKQLTQLEFPEPPEPPSAAEALRAPVFHLLCLHSSRIKPVENTSTLHCRCGVIHSPVPESVRPRRQLFVSISSNNSETSIDFPTSLPTPRPPRPDGACNRHQILAQVDAHQWNSKSTSSVGLSRRKTE